LGELVVWGAVIGCASGALLSLGVFLVTRRRTSRWSGPIRLAVVGRSASALALDRVLVRMQVERYRIVARVAPDELADLREIAVSEAVDVVLCAPHVQIDEVSSGLSTPDQEGGPHILGLVAFYESALGQLPVTEAGAIQSDFRGASQVHAGATAVKRVVDLGVAGIVGVVALPLFAVLAWLIRRDGGPAFFRQVRIGRGGNPFAIYKFRTMHPGGGDASWTFVDDPRVTRVGRVLRRTHLDELPQLWNVLKGDMSLVGPRPEQPEYVETLQQLVPSYRLRHLAKPGMTGWAQVHCGYARSAEESILKLCYDLHYLKHRSLRLELAIMARTARLLRGSLARGSSHELGVRALTPGEGEPELGVLVSGEASS
jgi:lipopolysaccharide/colanic/teichoic acid biosynthesis glycosyltransferase